MAKSIHRVSTVVREKTMVSSTVCMLRLADIDGWELPPFTPGAHVDVHLPSGLIRQYSLCGNPQVRNSYYIAVKLENDGRGGSREIHNLKEGAEILLSLPRNMMPLVDAPCVVLLAGGIGITPFVPMVHELNRSGRNYSLHYASKDSQDTPFKDLLTKECLDQVGFYQSDQGTRIDIAAVIADLEEGDHLYCCGPSRMIEDVLERTVHMSDRVHVEYFGGQVDPAQTAYTVHLARSNMSVPVSEGQTMLEALRVAGVEVPASCEGGICLDCKTRYLDGAPVHRDITMPKSERDRYLTPCVSGCGGESLTLDI